MNYKCLSLPLIAALAVISCNPPDPKTARGDSVVNTVIPPKSDNSQATNPSLADTAFVQKDSLSSSGKKK